VSLGAHVCVICRPVRDDAALDIIPSAISQTAPGACPAAASVPMQTGKEKGTWRRLAAAVTHLDDCHPAALAALCGVALLLALESHTLARSQARCSARLRELDAVLRRSCRVSTQMTLYSTSVAPTGRSRCWPVALRWARIDGSVDGTAPGTQRCSPVRRWSWWLAALRGRYAARR
jgi:hypothetical protein